MNECPDPEAHEAHMELNGDCPWCDSAYDPGAILSPDLPPDEAVAEVVRRHG